MKLSTYIKENMTVPIGGLYKIQSDIGAVIKKKKIKHLKNLFLPTLLRYFYH